MTKSQKGARNCIRRERYAHKRATERGQVYNKPWSVNHPTHDPRSRIINVEGAANIRSMQGIPTRDGGTLHGDRVLRGEAPYLLTSRGVRELVESGVTHFIDLRGAHERETEGNGNLQPYIDSGEVHVYPVSMTLDPDFLAQNPGFNPYDDLAATYVQVLEGSRAELSTALSSALKGMQEDGGKVYIHCAAGKDRTSMVVGALLDVAGADPDAIADDYVASASVFGAVVEKLKVRPEYKKDFVDVPPERFTPNRDVINRFVTLVDAQGGLDDVLVNGGMNPDAVTEWRNLLRG